ncbi:hypothetical protein B0A49_06914 [Cryomyces minteri]|uniref:Uncharacterized protein n=1 Tax=Cryomyces minteri TaxID=331657 RepID=A0A4V5NHW0_9PEZI|nr:hypothetical protein B0A49_06914 [Cryomyces minteri]
MSSFRAVNTTLTVSEQLPGRLGEETTPTTPRQNRTFAEMPSAQIRTDESTPNTPTRHSFGGVAGQRPLPASPFPSSHDATQAEGQRGLLTRGLSHQSTHSVDSQDVDMEDDDDDPDGSDNESVTSDSQRPSKKKKGQRFFSTSGLSYYQTPDQPRPYSSAQPAATQMTRLPGIESFDHVPFPSRPQPGPGSLSADATNRPSVFGPAPGPDNRRSQAQLDMSLHQNLTKLDITSAAPPQHEPQSWNQPADTRQSQAARHVTGPHSNHPFHAPMTATQPIQSPSAYTHVIKLDEVVTPRKHKRQAWYNGPIGPAAAPTAQPHYAAQRTSPEDSSSSEGIPTPSTSTVAEFHPSIVHASGYIEPHPVGPDDQQQKVRVLSYAPEPRPSSNLIRSDSGFYQAYPGSAANVQHYPLHSGHDPRSMQPPTDRGTDMGRLEALVAVATSEERTDNHRS